MGISSLLTPIETINPHPSIKISNSTSSGSCASGLHREDRTRIGGSLNPDFVIEG